jgi:hypothetical protein
MQLKKYILISVISFLVFSVDAIAQTSSPFSRIGIGDIVYANSARKLGMGQLSVADAQSNFISFYNPAGLFNLKRTRIEFSLNYSGSFLSGDNLSTYYAKTEFTGFMFAFPISNKYGIGAVTGLVPYSNVSYKVVNPVQTTNGDYQTTYQGKGGLSKLFLGSSYKLPFDLVIGATLDYYFGNIDYASSIHFLDATNADAQYTDEYRPKGLGTTLGIISPDLSGMFNSNLLTNLRIGFTYNYFSQLKTDSVLTSSTTLGQDTVSTGIVNMKIPGRLAAGLSFVLNNRYLLSLDYALQNWEKYSFNGLTSSNLRNASKMSLGFEFTPEQKLGASFWEQIIWRTGLSYEQTQYLVNNKGINQYSVSGGLSLPITTANTLDLGLQYAMRGASDPGLYKENIIRLSLTFSLGDIWFIREEK